MRRLDATRHPTIYEINTRVWLRELSLAEGKSIGLAEIPERALDEVAALGFDLIWMMGVCSTGAEGQRISREHPDLHRAYDKALPGWTAEDVIGSPYAVQSYTVAPELGGTKALALFRQRLAERGVGLVLDFVPNHTARDHLWVYEHPERYIHGSGEDAGDTQNYFRAHTARGERVLAFGRDPYFPGWTDTAQLNYEHRATRRAMTDALLGLAEQCDGVRCDMAMLLLSDIFERTWGERARVAPEDEAQGEFWAQALDEVKRRHPRFLFIAEAYWDLEWRMMSLGFDYAYDKRLLDRLRQGEAGPVRSHLAADAEFQERLVRFLENHDEACARAVFPRERHRAAAALTATSPGMRFFHELELAGKAVHLPVQLGRRPDEPTDAALRDFYRRLLFVIDREVFCQGRHRPLSPRAAWPENRSFEQLIARRWDAGVNGQALVVVNFGASRAQARLPVELPGLEGRRVLLVDQLSEERFERDGTELVGEGLYLDMAPWQAAIYDVVKGL
jgi:hypothetical protein